MEEIKENEYIRLENGIILKYGEEQSVKIENNTYTDYSGEYEWSSTVVKHSPNLIDLIEVGDIVNGCEVVSEKYEYIEMKFINIDSEISYGWGTGTIPESEIKTILTKKQYEKNCYKVEL